MNKERLQDITLPCWIYDTELLSELGSNRAAKDWGDVYEQIDLEREELRKGLADDGLVFFGKPKKFIAYEVRDKVFVQCLADLAIHTTESNGMDEVRSIEQEREDHKQTQEKLRQNSAKLRAIFDSTALYIWTMRSRWDNHFL